ncbi:DUF523 and DUF1722 domain-containing protein [Aurantivibrio plasticivorans]
MHSTNRNTSHSITSNPNKPLVAIGSCLVGKPVRFNGQHKRKHRHVEALKEFMDLTPICPEVGIGMGVPREPIRIVEKEGKLIATDSATQKIDVTEPLEQYAQQQLARHPDLCGYILVKDSPSCGLERVSRYNAKGNFTANDATGIYVSSLMNHDPLLPLEEDGRLHDPNLRESFVARVYVYHQWKQMRHSELTVNALLQFYARHKYLVMAHDVSTYKEIGPLLANAKQYPIDELADKTITLIMSALKKPATRRSQANVMHHIQGYLKQHISGPERQRLRELIEQYREGIIPMITPMTMLQHHFHHSPDEYIAEQVFMQPYPEALALRSHLA